MTETTARTEPARADDDAAADESAAQDAAAQTAGGAATARPDAEPAPPASTDAPSGQPAAPTASSPAAGSDAALFDAESAKDYQRRWQTIQVGFVDEPRAAVEQADKLVEEVLSALQDSFGRERQSLEQAWSGGNESSTEDLRQAIRRYRSFFNRLLTF